MSKDTNPQAFRKGLHPVFMTTGLAMLTGCTPEEQQAFLEQIPRLLGDLLSQLLVAQAQQLVTFAASFARNALAAFLF